MSEPHSMPNADAEWTAHMRALVAALKARVAELEAELESYRVEGAYQRGYKDAIQNDGRTNPYPPGMQSHRLWDAGFASIKA